MKIIVCGALLLAVGCCSAVAIAADGARTIRLETLDLSHMHQGWGTPQINRSIREKPLSIGGRTFERGVGTHASSVLWIHLAGGSEKFLASVGVDDAAGNPRGSLTFRVFVGGKKAFDSGLMKLGDPAKQVDLDLRGADVMTLVVDAGPNGTSYAHADWADARFVVSGKDPEAGEATREPAVILTPKPAPAPRINGPKIFGVRPGSPFLYRVPCTGDRPMSFAAKNLPEGLTLDGKSGIVTGSIAKGGEYLVTLSASNAKGESSRPFKIVCGDTLGLTPHMGWNSWYVWLDHVTDKIMRDAADQMVASGMADHGYMYVNIDDCWAVSPASKDPMRGGIPSRDAAGHIVSNKSFPDMKSLTDYIHAKGLRAGIYSSPGPLTCAGYQGSYQHEEDDAKQFADWGFDFLKYDWCSYGKIAPNPDLAARQKPYKLMGEIVKKQKRDIVFNLCQYGQGKVWQWGKEVGGNSWRTAGDLGMNMNGFGEAFLDDGFDVYANNELHKYGGPGGWNDPDYLLLGYLGKGKGELAPTTMSPNQQYTQVSLWALVAAPLIFSGDMSRLDEFTLNVLCNDEVIDVNQDALGKPGRRVAKDGAAEVWMRDLEDGSKAVGLFNRGEGDLTVTAAFKDLGLSGKQKVRDLWRQKDLGEHETAFEASLGRHGVSLIRLSPVRDQ